VVHTAGDTNAGGRHPDADMEGIGRLLGHRHPRGGLHLHHYKQQFFLNKKFFLPKQGKGVLWYTTTISDPSFPNPDPLNFIRPINQIRQIHQSISLELSISLEPSISSDPVQNSANPFKKFISFQKFWIHLIQFSNPFKISILGSA
jgi:hypothetical protein